ncbi:MAG: hypothetical protein ACT4NV_18130 [Rhodoferax sp.]
MGEVSLDTGVNALAGRALLEMHYIACDELFGLFWGAEKLGGCKKMDFF